MVSHLAERLHQARHVHFVGRRHELALFESALEAEFLPYFLLYIYGPGGVGKTALLQEFALSASKHHAQCVYLDARNIDPSPIVFMKTLSASLGAPEDASLPDFLAASPQLTVLLVDTYEALAPLDQWLRINFLPLLPEKVLTVLAGRNPLDSAWQADPGWQTLIRTTSLRNLSSEESRAFLTKRGIPDEQQGEALGFTHGHPLALSLVAELFSQRGSVNFHPEESPDVIKTLMERFIQKVPGPAHRAALEACAQARVMTESLLAGMLAMPTSEAVSDGEHELFNWLRGLSFMESSAEGIFPHDLARETLIADLRWRNPDWYVELHNRARKFYTDRLTQTSGLTQQRLMLDTVFLHRDNAVIRSFFDWQTTGGMVPYSMRASDENFLEKMVLTQEGGESKQLAAHWLRKYPQMVTIWRDANDLPSGFVMTLPLHEMNEKDAQIDPAVRSTLGYLKKHTPLQTGEVATLFRFWMASETYQNISPIQSLIFINVAKHYLTTPGLAFTFFPCADPDFWSAVLDYAELTRLPDVDFEVEGKRYGIYGHDWRVMSPFIWIAKLAEKEVGATRQTPPPTVEAMLVLSQSDFSAAVRHALQDYARPSGLAGNPLLRSRLVMERAGIGSGKRSELLKSEIRFAAESLQSNPHDEKLFRALDKTYLHPAPTQEAAAELLDLPFSTYRRHLTAGVQRLIGILWQKEIGEK